MPATIGPYTLHALDAGRFGLDGGAMFGIVPKPLWSRRIEPDDQNRIPLAMRCLLIEAPDRLVLVDTGIGDVFDGTKYAGIYAVDHDHSTLSGSLESVGYERADVTDVVLTHLHFDHCGGSTRWVDPEEKEERRPAFPNATYHVQDQHWEWARASNPKEKGSFLDRAFGPLETAGQLHRIDGAGRFMPGITLRLADGHTDAQQLVKISGPERTLVYAADLLPTRHHLAPAWTMAYDIRPLTTMEEKDAFLEEAVDAEWNLFFEHDPDAEVAGLRRTDRGIETIDARPLNAL